MTQARRKVMAVLVMGSTMTMETLAEASVSQTVPGDSPDRTLVVHAVNYPVLPRQVLDGARSRVDEIYARIGVRILWVESEDTVALGQDGRLHLTIILLSPEMARKQIAAQPIAKHVLGRAHLASWRAYIFCDRIAALPGPPTLLPLTLGNVIAHEMGHLLLRENRHSRRGLMSPTAELDAIHLENFDASQTRAIRRTVGPTTDAVAP